MKIQEAIGQLRCNVEGDYINLDDLEAFEMAINALEKQIPKRPIEDGCYDEPAVCPNCGGNVINQCDNDYKFQCCHYCGQKLDWNDHAIEKGGGEE